MRTFGTRLIALVALAMAAASCTVKETEAPALSGPSELALALSLQATPDSILQDGVSQSSISIDARGPNNQPVRNLTLRVAGRAVASAEGHAAIYKAIKERDAQAAELRMTAHIRDARDVLLRQIGEHGEGSG